jgi:Fe-S cluster biogenesis protein NfuA
MAIFDKNDHVAHDQDPRHDANSKNDSNNGAADASIRQRVEPLISQLRPYLQADGGDIELVGVEDAIVYVRLRGACSGCPSAIYTLKMGVEARIIEAVPEVKAVELA